MQMISWQKLLLCDKSVEVFGRQWPRKQVTLTMINPQFIQKIGLRSRLDTLGNRREIQCTCQGADGGGNRIGVRIIRRVTHKGCVDFQRVDRELAQIGK